MNLILASNSPRRKQLLALTDLNFIVSAADVDESQYENESPANYVLRLAEKKARAIKTDADAIILASDTTVVDGANILGKPKDDAEAARMLTQLRGRTHQVYTAVALLRASDGLLLTDLCITDVPMRSYSDEEIHNYVATGDPLDKAGSYAIQHPEFSPVASMEGCYASVMGLPLCHVTRMLHKMDIHLKADVPSSCQKLLEYDCPIYETVIASGD